MLIRSLLIFGVVFIVCCEKPIDGKPDPSLIEQKFPEVHIQSYDTEDPVQIGNDTTYVFLFSNKGTAKCTQELLKIEIPLDAILVSSEVYKKKKKLEISYFYDNSKRMISYSHLVVKPKETVTYKISVKQNTPGEKVCRLIWSIEELPKYNIKEELTDCYKE